MKQFRRKQWIKGFVLFVATFIVIKSVPLNIFRSPLAVAQTSENAYLASPTSRPPSTAFPTSTPTATAAPTLQPTETAVPDNVNVPPAKLIEEVEGNEILIYLCHSSRRRESTFKAQ